MRWIILRAGLRVGKLPFSMVPALFLIVVSGMAATPPTESDVLSALADSGISANLGQTVDAAGRLAAAVGNLCAAPDEGRLQLARAAWRDAWLSYKRTELFLFDSGDKLTQSLGNWPVNDVMLDAVVSSEKYRHANSGTDVRGFPGSEYLLFKPKDAATATADERCNHLTDITSEITNLLSDARQEWEQTLKSKFISAGDGEPFLVPGDALSLAVVRMLNVVEHMLREGMGVPSGFFIGGVEGTRPDRLEAWISKSTADGFLATLGGVRRVLMDGSTSIADLIAMKDGLVEAKNPALVADIRKQLDKVEKTVAGLGGSERIHRNTSVLKNLYKQVQKLQDQLIEAALVLELNVNILELGAREQW